MQSGEKHRIVRKGNSQTRLQRYVEQYQKLVAGYGKDNPYWQLEALCWLMKCGVRNLRLFVESKLDGRITAAPCLTFNFSVNLDWEMWKTSQGGHRSIDLGTFSAANTSTRKRALDTMADILVRHITVLAMQELTADVAYEKQGNRLTPILPPDLAAELLAIKGKNAQQTALGLLFQPFCVGVLPVALDYEKLRPNRAVPKEICRQLARASEMMNLPPLEWPLRLQGHTMRLRLVFQIHPFVVEPKLKAAYFPLTIGVQIHPDESDGEKLLALLNEPWADALNWTNAEKDEVWSQIVAVLEELAKNFGPKPTSELEAAILSLNVQLKVAGQTGSGEDMQAISDRLMKTFRKTGQIMEWHCDTISAGAVASPLQWTRLSDEDFERLLYNLLGAAPGYENAQWLTHTKAPDRGRDISVNRVVRDSLSGTRRLRVIVQCRHKKSIGFSEVSQLKEQMRLLEPPRVDELIVATSGCFSTDAVQWIERHNGSNYSLLITMWPRSHLEKLLAERPYLIKKFGLN